MKYAYTPGRSTPALMVPVKVVPLFGGPARDGIATVDTGSDLTVLPDQMVVDLSLKPVGARIVQAALGGKEHERLSYQVVVSVLGCGRYEVNAVAHDEEELILGRDVLNQLVLHADGPKRLFEVTAS